MEMRSGSSWGDAASLGCSLTVEILREQERAVLEFREIDTSGKISLAYANQKWVLHCCGIKDCGVISHYRVGSVIANKKDELYHQRYRGKSLESHPPPQTRVGRPD